MNLEIIKYGHPVLRQKGASVECVNDEIRQLVTDMLETMYLANGVGLAAQQVGHALMLTVIDVRASELPSTMEIEGKTVVPADYMPLILLNPVVKSQSGNQIGPEGCLSVPEVTADLARAISVEVEAQMLDHGSGEVSILKFRCGGLLGRAVQHEVDHLMGILIIDRMDAATRASFSGQLKRMQKETQTMLAAKSVRK